MKEPPFPTREDVICGWIDLCHTENDSVEFEESFWGYILFEKLTENFPMEAYQMIKDTLLRDNSHAVVGATGMSLLVNLIGSHGDDIIDLLEQDVEIDSNLKNALGGIYNQGASKEVWKRLRKLV